MNGLEPAALAKLATWLSPGYPVGAFAYSHGLEWAIASGQVTDAAGTGAWMADCIARGSGRNDAILLAHAWAAAADPGGDPAALAGLAELAEALAPAQERLAETSGIGAAFAAVTGDAWGGSAAPLPYPVAVGVAAAEHGIPRGPAVLLFLQAMAASLVSAAVRLVPLGQTEGQRILAALLPEIGAVAAAAETASLDELGGCAFLSDIAAMRHETQEVRLFRT
ncbi:urease accessory protein UreF [Paralimibaculum aggregatum]|uniref:Urease accessory protein UreF n=1 Tax=Paralimibaculum aggregatum TaxID=3036245 RepID=A0ABQ6LQC4_9RHOB|nr:urease accessory UreF family protein [Limibaculum sp. NKW23]GMG84142.1 urease accessory protein UreF [Limibaculum sp. NKW23]